MKTTKKLSLNKETIAHLSRTEGRTVVGGAVIKSQDTCQTGACGTAAGSPTCVATCVYKTCTCTAQPGSACQGTCLYAPTCRYQGCRTYTC